MIDWEVFKTRFMEELAPSFGTDILTAVGIVIGCFIASNLLKRFILR